jgi:hypothetical protein
MRRARSAAGMPSGEKTPRQRAPTALPPGPRDASAGGGEEHKQRRRSSYIVRARESGGRAVLAWSLAPLAATARSDRPRRHCTAPGRRYASAGGGEEHERRQRSPLLVHGSLADVHRLPGRSRAELRLRVRLVAIAAGTPIRRRWRGAGWPG